MHGLSRTVRPESFMLSGRTFMRTFRRYGEIPFIVDSERVQYIYADVSAIWRNFRKTLDKLFVIWYIIDNNYQ